MTQSAAMTELSALFPKAEVIKRDFPDGKTLELTIPVLPIGKLGEVTKLLLPIIEGAPPDASIRSLLLRYIDVGVEILACALDKPVEYIHAMPPDLAAECLMVLVRANTDFFAQRVSPKVAQLVAAGADATKPAGPTP